MTPPTSRSKSDPEGGGLTIKEHLAASGCETENRPLMVAKHAGIHQAIIYRPNCKKWSCPYCSQQRGRWFMAMAGYGHDELKAEGHDLGFMTITSHAKVRTLKRGIFVWRKAWRKLLRRIKRQTEHLAYLQIPEQHKSGAYHVHLMTTATVSQRWIKDNAIQCGFGYIADFEEIMDAKKAAWYVSKYLTKDSHKLQWPKFFRRVNTSRNWPRPAPLVRNEQWAVTRQNSERSVQAILAVLEAQEWAVSVFTR